ncbi:anaerobic ribonucleoside-triphosphate reductase [Sporomusa sp.]|uniref:anaerobic ribonucleoside-triphosphate reductase n=1 Tax=Sporomusa sp. TaxID=2078658 RepID=UPI002C0D8EFC|nr:anaerobic ribonucleoside-triphosphate reductase [Sporomusa sp.]HWR43233.1 anaerobic ribonucleoside-triphosphate reductase [Sporomusa sp.]
MSAVFSEKEAEYYIKEEFQYWQAKGKVSLELDGNEVVLKAIEKSPITRVKRITGYLAKVDSFNDAKNAELDSRRVHQ